MSGQTETATVEPTIQHRPMRAMQWSNSHPEMVTLHICRVFRQETSGFQQAVVRRSENLDLIPSEEDRCPELRCQS